MFSQQNLFIRRHSFVSLDAQGNECSFRSMYRITGERKKATREKSKQINHRNDHNSFSDSGWCFSSHYLHLTFDIAPLPLRHFCLQKSQFWTLVWRTLINEQWHQAINRTKSRQFTILELRLSRRGRVKEETITFKGKTQDYFYRE